MYMKTIVSGLLLAVTCACGRGEEYSHLRSDVGVSESGIESATTQPSTDDLSKVKAQLNANDEKVDQAMEALFGAALADYEELKPDLVKITEDLESSLDTLDKLVKIYEASAQESEASLTGLVAKTSLSEEEKIIKNSLESLVGVQRLKVSTTEETRADLDDKLQTVLLIREYMDAVRPKLLEKIKALGG